MTRAESAALCAVIDALGCLERGWDTLARECMVRCWETVIGARL